MSLFELSFLSEDPTSKGRYNREHNVWFYLLEVQKTGKLIYGNRSHKKADHEWVVNNFE